MMYKIWLSAIIMLAGYAAAFADYSYSDEKQADISRFSSGWFYYFDAQGTGTPETIPDDRWRPYHPGKLQDIPAQITIFLKKRIDGMLTDNAAVFIPQYVIYSPFEASCGNRLIYQSGKLEPSSINKHLYIRWHLIPLPPECSNRSLFFKIFSDHPRYFPTPENFYTGERNALFDRFIIGSLIITVIGIIFILAGTFVAVFAGYSLFRTYPELTNQHRTRGHIRYFAFATMTFFSGVSLFAVDSSLTQLFFHNVAAQSYLRFIAFYLFMAGLWGFLEAIRVGIGIINRILRRFYVTCAVSMAFFELAPVNYFEMLLNTSMTVSICAALISVISITIAGIRGSWKDRILFIGFGIFALSGVTDMLAALSVFRQEQIVYPWGLFILYLSMGWVLILKHGEEKAETFAKIRKSEERYRNLFNNAPVIILETDFTRHPPSVSRCNAQTGKTFGVIDIPFTLDRIMTAESVAALISIKEQLASGQVLQNELSGISSDGSETPLRMIASAAYPPAVDHVIVALENIRDEKELRSQEEAIQTERRRIAREIHDGIAQDLAAIRLKIKFWRHLLNTKPEKLHEELEELKTVVTKNIKNIRRSIFALRSVDLEKMGFFPALQKFIEDFSVQNQMDIDVSLIGLQDQLPRVYEPVIFSIIQESLNNAVKHGQAQAAWVSLDFSQNHPVIVKIRDNGAGFDPDILSFAENAGHIGIRQMRERIESLKGTFWLRSRIGKGTEIEIVLT